MSNCIAIESRFCNIDVVDFESKLPEDHQAVYQHFKLNGSKIRGIAEKLSAVDATVLFGLGQAAISRISHTFLKMSGYEPINLDQINSFLIKTESIERVVTFGQFIGNIKGFEDEDFIIPQSEEEALRLLKLGAKKGWSEFQFFLAMYYMFGNFNYFSNEFNLIITNQTELNEHTSVAAVRLGYLIFTLNFFGENWTSVKHKLLSDTDAKKFFSRYCRTFFPNFLLTTTISQSIDEYIGREFLLKTRLFAEYQSLSENVEQSNSKNFLKSKNLFEKIVIQEDVENNVVFANMAKRYLNLFSEVFGLKSGLSYTIDIEEPIGNSEVEVANIRTAMDFDEEFEDMLKRASTSHLESLQKSDLAYWLRLTAELGDDGVQMELANAAIKIGHSESVKYWLKKAVDNNNGAAYWLTSQFTASGLHGFSESKKEAVEWLNKLEEKKLEVVLDGKKNPSLGREFFKLGQYEDALRCFKAAGNVLWCGILEIEALGLTPNPSNKRAAQYFSSGSKRKRPDDLYSGTCFFLAALLPNANNVTKKLSQSLVKFFPGKYQSFATRLISLVDIDIDFLDKWIVSSIDNLDKTAFTLWSKACFTLQTSTQMKFELLHEASEFDDPAIKYIFSYACLGEHPEDSLNVLELAKSQLHRKKSSVIPYSANPNPNENWYDEAFLGRLSQAIDNAITSLHLEQKHAELEKSNADLKKAQSDLEDVMAMFAHKFRGPLDSILFNSEHQHDERVYADAARTMNGLLDIFSYVSTSSEILAPRLREDRSGTDTPLAVFERSLKLAAMQLASGKSRERMSPHYLNYAKKVGQAPAELTLLIWSDEEEWQEIERAYQALWEDEIGKMFGTYALPELLTWFESHLMKFEIKGLAESTLQFRLHGTKASVLTVVLQELIVNAIKHYDTGSSMPIEVIWNESGVGVELACLNPSTLSSRRRSKSKGSGRGHKFLELIARNIHGTFAADVISDNSSVSLFFPSSVMKD